MSDVSSWGGQSETSSTDDAPTARAARAMVYLNTYFFL